jgi:hypothetical protein
MCSQDWETSGLSSKAKDTSEHFTNGNRNISIKELAKRFLITEPAIAYSVRRGQKIAQEKGWLLVEGE